MAALLLGLKSLFPALGMLFQGHAGTYLKMDGNEHTNQMREMLLATRQQLSLHQPVTPPTEPEQSVTLEKPMLIPQFLDRWLQIAEKAVGAITILLSIAAFAIGLQIHDLRTATVSGLVTFGLVGALELTLAKWRLSLRERMEAKSDNELFCDIRKAHPDWKPEILKEFTHSGLFFRSIGFDNLKIPLTVTPPLCPKCKGHLAERRKIIFPPFVKFRHFCICGFSQLSSLTISELRKEAE